MMSEAMFNRSKKAKYTKVAVAEVVARTNTNGSFHFLG